MKLMKIPLAIALRIPAALNFSFELCLHRATRFVCNKSSLPYLNMTHFMSLRSLCGNVTESVDRNS